MKSRCLICKGPSPDLTKRFDPAIGFICAECHGFLLRADKVLRKVGIEGVTMKPERHVPKSDT